MPTYLSSLQRGLHAAFAADDAVYLLGEDVLDPYGGAFKVSKGLSSAYPTRVITTPISEAAITGVAAGMALRGLRPVVEIMFGDFLTLCMDQILNGCTKFRAMYNNAVSVPMVIRTPMGGGRGYGATHSQSLEKFFLGIPGLAVVAPSHVHDPGALLKQVISTTAGPVLFIENKLLYPMDLAPAQCVIEGGYPTALLKNYTKGKPDVTVISYGGTSRLLLPLMETLAKEEIRILCALPSSLKPVPVESLCNAAAESGRVVIVEEGTAGFNWGSEISARLYEGLWGRLRMSIRRVASADEVIPTNQSGEDRVLTSPAAIEKAILEAIA